MIGAIDQSDPRVWMAQMFAEGKPPETSPQDNDMPRVLARHAQTVGEGSGCVKAAQGERTKKGQQLLASFFRSRTSSLLSVGLRQTMSLADHGGGVT